MNKALYEHQERLDREKPVMWKRVCGNNWWVIGWALFILLMVIADSDFIGLVRSWL